MADIANRRLRAFKRWMKSRDIDCSDALELLFDQDREEAGEIPVFSFSVRTLCDLHEGDLVATIPKECCLTVKTTDARHLIEAAGLDGCLGLSVALMYERSLGHLSPWFPYLQLLPHSECIPLLWSVEEIDSLLVGTELHKIVKEDKALVHADWEECILPLLASAPAELNSVFFSVEQYLAARSLIASRSFAIDDYHGDAMVPLADLFNHKTGAEDVHFTCGFSHPIHESSTEDNGTSDEYENAGDGEHLTQNSPSSEGSSGGTWESSSTIGNDQTLLEMIVVKDVKSGAEVFNTYGSLGNAALLHRYGFTDLNNPYDIVNIDLELVLQWSSSLFSSRHTRVRLSLLRRCGYSGCVSQNSEYFEISSNGEPQVELLILLYILLLPEEAFFQLDLTVSTAGTSNGFSSIAFLKNPGKLAVEKSPEMSKDMLLTEGVRGALFSLADIRDSFYGSTSREDDIKDLKRCCHARQRNLYHSLILRLSERKIIENLRSYAASSAKLSTTVRRVSTGKRFKR